MSDALLKLISDLISEKDDSACRERAYENGVGKGSAEYCGCWPLTFKIREND